MIQDTANQLALFATEDSDTTNYGWMGSIAQFQRTSIASWLKTMEANYQALYQQRATATQKQAWQDCATLLQHQFETLLDLRSDSVIWTLIFEYELPREGGRRPDLVLLGSGQIVLFEFKQKTTAAPADLDQVAAYGRDLSTYHSASHGHRIWPIVVPTRCQAVELQSEPQSELKSELKSELRSGDTTRQILNPNQIATYLSQLELLPELDPIAWVKADYAPLPTVIQAARTLFQQEALPQIKRAHSAGIPELLDHLYQLVDQAKTNQERHLVLITGVPGAGKTLVGLQFVHQQPVHQQSGEPDSQAVFLSGNGPLITVLQYALKSKVFVQAIRNFYLHHEVRQQKAPTEHLIVFDEAQRAWDTERMAEKYGIQSAAAGTILRIAERVENWCVVIALIGEGQEIHVGEEDGIEQWNQGLLASTAPWQLHCAPGQTEFFTAVPTESIHAHSRFNLTTSLRSHLASQVQDWAAHLLSGEIGIAATLMPKLNQAGFDAYLTRDLGAAKAYCRDRYADQPDKRYGLVASSRARNLPNHGIPNDYRATSRLNVGAWYIDPPESPQSCCALDRVVTEFSCQGLELDFPIVSWGDDLRWDESWITTGRQRNVRNPLRLRLNSYRVLLTRGRDGLIIFVPPEAKMDSTYEILEMAGIPVLPAPAS